MQNIRALMEPVLAVVREKIPFTAEKFEELIQHTGDREPYLNPDDKKSISRYPQEQRGIIAAITHLQNVAHLSPKLSLTGIGVFIDPESEFDPAIRTKAVTAYFRALNSGGFQLRHGEKKDYELDVPSGIPLLALPAALRFVIDNPKLMKGEGFNTTHDNIESFVGTRNPETAALLMKSIADDPVKFAANEALVKTVAQQTRLWNYQLKKDRSTLFRDKDDIINADQAIAVVNSFAKHLGAIAQQDHSQAASNVVNAALGYLAKNGADQTKILPQAQNAYMKYKRAVDDLPPHEQPAHYATLAIHAPVFIQEPEALAQKFLYDMVEDAAAPRALTALRALDLLMPAIQKSEDTLFGGPRMVAKVKSVTQYLISQLPEGHSTRDYAENFSIFWTGQKVGFGGITAIGDKRPMSEHSIDQYRTGKQPLAKYLTLFLAGDEIKIQERNVGPVAQRDRRESGFLSSWPSSLTGEEERDFRAVSYELTTFNRAAQMDRESYLDWQCRCCSSPNARGPRVGELLELIKAAKKDDRLKETEALAKFKDEATRVTSIRVQEPPRDRNGPLFGKEFTFMHA